MKTSDGFQQYYNGQLAVDGEFQIIVANRQSNNPADSGCLVPLLDKVRHTVADQPACCLADAGYRKEADFQLLEARRVDGYISLRREGKQRGDIDPNRHPTTAGLAEKLVTPDGRANYAQRKHIVEAVNRWIKNVLGSRRFSLRGLEPVQGKWDLVCLSLNLRRMSTLMSLS